MRIELEKLEESGGRFSRTYEIDQLAFDEYELRLIEVVSVEGRLRRKAEEVELRGKLRTQISVACGRCLKSVELPIDVEFSDRFTPAVSWKDEEQHELNENDLNLAVFDGEAIELDDLVREEIVLALPGHVLCDEACKGLCPTCGGDLNAVSCDCTSKLIDSRWEKLKDLRS
ncbi:MAG TPA: DUF177 domain-containing protein [Pyrinomonadaceae bacterium]|nr:DUF177 domain-containing protein [Pyrinomonadaceae bacterium]